LLHQLGVEILDPPFGIAQLIDQTLKNAPGSGGMNRTGILGGPIS
jgi:hypothetical protein